MIISFVSKCKQIKNALTIKTKDFFPVSLGQKHGCTFSTRTHCTQHDTGTPWGGFLAYHPDPTPILKDPLPHMQGAGGHSFQLSPSPEGVFGLQEPPHLRSELPLGQYTSNEQLMQGYKVPAPLPQLQRTMKGQRSSRSLLRVHPMNFLLANFSLRVCYPGNLINHNSTS